MSIVRSTQLGLCTIDTEKCEWLAHQIADALLRGIQVCLIVSLCLLFVDDIVKLRYTTSKRSGRQQFQVYFVFNIGKQRNSLSENYRVNE
ncbi:hypothetical protein SDC9_140277 [bioreactor metagenome]|uniref:Uncharacterized protein n=1 Tax=bioreactor metagenome TaxID=1076179 RepID=A0A645DUY9_9ZZZZ